MRIFGFVLMSLFCINARADGDVRFANVTTAIWPEYDKPSVLVIHRVSLDPSVALPAIVPIAVPLAAKPHAVAKRGEDGVLYLAEYSRKEEGDYATLLITTDRPDLQIEYYIDLVREGEQRSLRLTWAAGVEVGDLSYEVQQPRGAMGLMITPPSAEQKVGADGLTYHFASLGPVAKGQQAVIALGYSRTTDTPSLGKVAAPPPAAPGEPAATDLPPPAATTDMPPQSKDQPWIWVAIGAVIVALSFAVWRARQGKAR